MPRSYRSDLIAPRKSIKGKPLELGVTGTVVSGGLILSDPNVELQFPRSIAIYDKMRRTDGQVKASLLAITLPILSLDWDIEPYKETQDEGGKLGTPTPEDLEIAKFVKTDLLEGLTTSWKHILRQLLGHLWAGFWVIEPVYETRDDGKVHLRKLGSRLPSSVFRWKIARDGGLQAIIQRAVNPETGMTELIEINAEDLVVFTHEREGADWSGISVLRSAYKHFYMKDWLYRLGVINVERGGGFPVITLPEEAVDNDLQAAHDVGESLHMHERAYVIEPPGWKFRLESGSTRIGDVMTQVEHHDQKISANILAQFMDLGSSSSGSRALGGEFIDIFLMAEEAVIFNIEDTVNNYLIKRWVDYNWTIKEGRGYPKLKAQNIRGFNVRRMGAILRMLADGKLVTPDEPLEAFLRNTMGLPEADPDSRRDMAPALPPGLGGPGNGNPFAPANTGKGGPQLPKSDQPGTEKPSVPGKTEGPNPAIEASRGDGADKGEKTTAALSEHNLGNVQIPVPASVADAVRKWQGALAPDVFMDGPKAIEADPHITIKYGLSTVNGQEVQNALKGIRAIKVTLGAMRVFEQPDQDVVAVAVDSPDLVKANTQISKTVSWEDAFSQAYIPHMTVAYVKRGQGQQFVNDETFKGMKWTADEVAFKAKADLGEHVITLSRPHYISLAEKKPDLTNRPFFYRRPLTALERTVNFAEIDAKQKAATKDILNRIKPILQQQADALATLVAAKPDPAPGAKRLDGVTQIKVPMVGKMAGVIKGILKEVYDYGRVQVRRELQRQADVRGGKARVTLDERLECQRKLAENFNAEDDAFDYFGAKADVLSERYANKLKDAAVSAKLKAVRSGKSEEDEHSYITDALLALSGVSAVTMFFQSVAEAFGIGRRMEASALGRAIVDTEGQDTDPDRSGVTLPNGTVIENAQYSAVMDDNTCGPCSDKDGTIGSPDDPEMQVPNPDCIGEQYGNTCRCVLIYQLAN